MDCTDKLLLIYASLFNKFGPQKWWPANSAFEVCIGAILTQSTSWKNVEKAIQNLKNAGILSYKGIRKTTPNRLSLLIKSSLYHNEKARKLKSFTDYLAKYHGGNLKLMLSQTVPKLRADLLSIWGIGPETADSIILYAANKPSFVVDAYTRRVFERLGYLKGGETYDEVNALFEMSLPRRTQLYNEYHALIVRQCKDYCKGKPACTDCPIRPSCKFKV